MTEEKSNAEASMKRHEVIKKTVNDFFLIEGPQPVFWIGRIELPNAKIKVTIEVEELDGKKLE